VICTDSRLHRVCSCFCCLSYQRKLFWSYPWANISLYLCSLEQKCVTTLCNCSESWALWVAQTPANTRLQSSFWEQVLGKVPNPWLANTAQKVPENRNVVGPVLVLSITKCLTRPT
jgi:hypothetical protein